MAKGRFLIAPLDSGLQTNVRPWLLPENAFEELNNAYVFRSRIRKRPGTSLLQDGTSEVFDGLAQLTARLRISLGNVDGSGNSTPGATVPLDGGVPITANIGSAFSVGSELFTVYQATGDMYSTGSATGTFDTTTGEYTITGAEPDDTIYFYPSLPVMGIVQYETLLINDEPTYAFDTRFAYQYASNGWLRLGTAVWTGDDTKFFWGRVWRGLAANEIYLFVTNFNFGSTLDDSDFMKYWDGSIWNDFRPQFSRVDPTKTILQARIIMPFKNRLVLMNIVENTGASPGTNIQYGNRIRFSQNGSPIPSMGDPIAAWNENVGGRGGYIDAPTEEQIVSAEFVRDRLIVFFERSTYELVYTGNEILPFRFQKIDNILGVESTFSVVQFDKNIIGIGDTGIHVASSTAVQRVDLQIPDIVFTISNDNNGVLRVQGVRDFYGELIYWAYPQYSEQFPDRVLLYNYRNNTWATFDDSFTSFGYFNNQGDRVWEATYDTWQELDEPWISGVLNKGTYSVVGGNQQGYVFFIEIDQLNNAASLQITDISLPVTITCYNHNLRTGDYITLSNMAGVTIEDLYGNEIPITQVSSVIDANTFEIDHNNQLVGEYLGGGVIARVSLPSVLTKQYNFFIKDGIDFTINKIDVQVDRTGEVQEDGTWTGGNISVDWMINASEFSLGTQIVETYPLVTYYPMEATQYQLWRTVYPNAEGYFVQLRYYLNDIQMRDPLSAFAAFTLHSFIYYADPTRSRIE